MAYRDPAGNGLRQSDLLAGVTAFALSKLDDPERPEGTLLSYRYSVVVTQDCDLEQDYKVRFPEGEEPSVSTDKMLFGVLLCGAYDAEKVRAGSHREQAQKFNAKEWKAVERNQDPRYEFIGAVPGEGLSLVVDFKDYFMVPCRLLYAQLAAGSVKRVKEMDSPYREHVLQRFAWYLMRVGLPVDFHRLTTPDGAT